MIAMLALAAVPVGPPVPSVGQLTSEALTTPNEDFWCTVIGADGNPRKIAFHLVGARGYPTGGTPAFAATPTTFAVTSDETGVFEASDQLSDSPSGFSGKWQNGPLVHFSRNGQVLTKIQFFPSLRQEAALVIERQTRPMMSAMPDFPYAGICRTASISQTPLNAAPSKMDRGQ